MITPSSSQKTNPLAQTSTTKGQKGTSKRPTSGSSDSRHKDSILSETVQGIQILMTKSQSTKPNTFVKPTVVFHKSDRKL